MEILSMFIKFVWAWPTIASENSKEKTKVFFISKIGWFVNEIGIINITKRLNNQEFDEGYK